MRGKKGCEKAASKFIEIYIIRRESGLNLIIEGGFVASSTGMGMGVRDGVMVCSCSSNR